MKAKDIPADLAEAILTFERLGVGDFIYDIREQSDGNWDAPDVGAWSRASMAVDKYAALIKAEMPAPKASAFKP